LVFGVRVINPAFRGKEESVVRNATSRLDGIDQAGLSTEHPQLDVGGGQFSDASAF